MDIGIAIIVGNSIFGALVPVELIIAGFIVKQKKVIRARHTALFGGGT